MRCDKSFPRVPDLIDPQPKTPVTSEFETGTANVPDVGNDDGEPSTLTIDGNPVMPDSRIVDALEHLNDDIVSVETGAEGVEDDAGVTALCYYDRDGDYGDEVGPETD